MSKTPNAAHEDKVNQALLNDVIVRLESEAIEYVVPLIDALQGASASELELLFERPKLFPRTVLHPLGRDSVVGEPAIAQMPDYLVLTRESCCQLWERPSTLVTHAHSGYRSRSGNSFLTLLHACDADKIKSFPVQVEGKDFVPPQTKFGFWGSWAFWSDGRAVQYQVRPEDVFVRQSEFRRWRLEHSYPRAKKSAARDQHGRISEENSLLKQEIGDDHKSTALLLMCEAAFVLWAHKSVVFDNPSTFPSDDAVVAWLLDQSDHGTFTKTSAREAARLIKPPFARKREAAGSATADQTPGSNPA